MKENILVVRMGALGDTVVCLPLLLALKKKYNVYFLGRMPGIFFLRDHVTKVYDIEESHWNWVFGEAAKINVNLIPTFHIILAFISKYQDILKANFEKVFPSSKIFIHPSLPSMDKGKTHILKYMFNKAKVSRLLVEWEDIKSFIKDGLWDLRANQNKIIYHIGSGSAKKNLGLEIWSKIEDQIRILLPSKEHKYLIGPDELEILNPISDIRGIDQKRFELSLHPADLISLLQDTFLFLGHDSGPTHLAALLGIPTIAMFKESSIKTWRPLGKSVKVLSVMKHLDLVDAVSKIVRRLFPRF